MWSCKFSAILLVATVGYVSGAAKPLSLEEVGRKIQDFSRKIYPALQGVCGLINSVQGGYQQRAYQGYPQVYYPGYAISETPSYPGTYPQILGNTPQIPVPNSNGKIPNSKSFSEQDDLLNFNTGRNANVPPPPQIQDIFKNFDKLEPVDLERTRKELENRSKFKFE